MLRGVRSCGAIVRQRGRLGKRGYTIFLQILLTNQCRVRYAFSIIPPFYHAVEKADNWICNNSILKYLATNIEFAAYKD
jgi:hypothetical protein